MQIKILPEEVLKAKEDIIKFDRIKTFNKCKSSNNYKGLLGEIVLNRYLTEMNIKHKWVEFNKQDTTQPDFIINNRTIDLKVSTDGNLWVGNYTPHDFYICAQIDDDNEVMYINGWISREDLVDVKRKSTKLTLYGREVYIINHNDIYVCSISPRWFPLYLGNMSTIKR